MKHCNKNLTLSILFLILAVSFVLISKEKNVIRDIKKVSFAIQRLEMDLTDNQATVYAKWINKTPLTVLSVPLYYQKYSLSCEIAALRMALAYKGVLLTEDKLIADLEFDTKNPPTRDQKTNQKIWGNPNKGFVGIINGKMPLTGYGVYEKPILDVALKYTPASILASTTIDSLVRAIDENNPVVVWGSVTKGKDTSWKDEFGNLIKAIEGEHARVVVGYRGESKNPTNLLLLDPTYGKIQMTTDEFATDWGLLDNKAVIIY